MENYVDFAVQKAVELLAIDSPTGYTAEAEEFVLREFRALGFAAERTAKGGILIDLGGESTSSRSSVAASPGAFKRRGHWCTTAGEHGGENGMLLLPL